MEKRIVILENNWEDYKKIRSYFPGYNYYPDVQSLEQLSKFLQDIKDALNDSLPEQDRKTAREKVISLFEKNCNNVLAFIIDYQLKSDDDYLTGLAFHKLFIRGDYKKIYTNKDMPCIMPTHMEGNILSKIKSYAEDINDSSLFDFTFKPNIRDDDTKYKSTLQNFVDNAYHSKSETCQKCF